MKQRQREKTDKIFWIERFNSSPKLGIKARGNYITMTCVVCKCGFKKRWRTGKRLINNPICSIHCGNKAFDIFEGITTMDMLKDWNPVY